MPIMKLPIHGGQTAWIPFPHTVFSITDHAESDCYLLMDPHHGASSHYTIKGHSARAIKRSIQENTDEHIGFLKLAVGNTGRTMYVNTFYIESLESRSATKARIYLRGGGFPGGDDGTQGRLDVSADPAQLALQLRRIVRRLVQDEEFCCDEPAAEDDSE